MTDQTKPPLPQAWLDPLKAVLNSPLSAWPTASRTPGHSAEAIRQKTDKMRGLPAVPRAAFCWF